MDGTVAVFDAATGTALHCLKGHFKPVRDLTFTPGGGGGWSCVDTTGDCRLNLFL